MAPAGGASPTKGLIGTPTRRGLTFVRAKVSKTRLGLCPKTPVACSAGYGSQGSHGRICPFPPPPFPTRERGPDGRVRLGRQFGARGMLGFAGSQAANPWLWLAGLAVCTEREGVPLPRSGGGWEGADAPAAPYKHRLAYAPGNRPLVFRAGVPVRWVFRAQP